MKVKLEHFKNLVAVAAADGYLNSREREFLADRAQELGLSEKEVKDILADGDQLQYLIPLNTEEVEDQISEAVFMSIIDGEIADQEYKLCLSLAERLGVESVYVDQMVSAVKAMWAR